MLLVEVQTEKTPSSTPSPAAGKVARILVAEGDVVPVGTGVRPCTRRGRRRLAPLSAPEQPRAEEAPAKQAAERKQVAKVLARPRSCARSPRSWGSISRAPSPGTGPQGRVTEEDVRAAWGGQEARGGPRRGPARSPPVGVRRLIAEHMARAHREVPAVTWVEECDFCTGLHEKAGRAHASQGRR